MKTFKSAWFAIIAGAVFLQRLPAADEFEKFEDPGKAIRFLIITLQNQDGPIIVAKFKHLFDPKYFQPADPQLPRIFGTDPRAVDWKLPILPKGKILWIAVEGDGDIVMAALQTSDAVEVFTFALSEIGTGAEWEWVIRPPGNQDPFAEELRPWHNRRIISAQN